MPHLPNWFLPAAHHLAGRERKGALLAVAIGTLRRAARLPVSVNILAGLIAGQLQPLAGRKADGALRLLVLNSERYRPDLDELGSDPQVELLALPSRFQHMINAIWLSDIRDLTENDPTAYHKNEHPRIRTARANLQALLVRIINKLAKRSGINAIVTCSFFYDQDQDWAAAARRTPVPFVALHKENMQDPVIQPASERRYRNHKYRFLGDRLIVFNELAKGVFLRSGIVDADRIAVAGAIRIDALMRRTENLPPPRRQVTLFSFHHCVGMLQLENTDRYFSNNPELGFYHYFDQVHGAMAKLAAQDPSIEVWIKPKWLGNWPDRIREAIRRHALDSNKIPNLHISIERPAQQLIEESAVVVGINSTTLLEAKLCNRPVVMPLFAEAAGKYYDRHVYFQKYLNDVFNVARSPEELIQAIVDEMNNTAPRRVMPVQMIRDYLGYTDQTVKSRVIAVIREAVNAAHGRNIAEI